MNTKRRQAGRAEGEEGGEGTKIEGIERLQDSGAQRERGREKAREREGAREHEGHKE